MAALAVVFGLSGCLNTTDQSSDRFPPDRAAWAALPVGAKAEHARALNRALSTYESVPVAWSRGDVAGTITAEPPIEIDGASCRVFRDRLEGAVRAEVSDLACRRGHWYYVREGGEPRFVLRPAYDEEDRVVVVERRASLSRIARDAGVDEGALAELNPALPRRIPAGSILLLP